ncbi:MAG: glutamate carboxypeptidase, partial [Gaiellales bacterium]|nr:glutamate carboxypeptidase [Gaiellales bacterium]
MKTSSSGTAGLYLAAVTTTVDVFCHRLEQLVNLDSPSEGLEQEAVAELLAAWLEPVGCTAEWVPEPELPARSMIIRLPGGGDRPVALLGHTDTVFPLGTADLRPFVRRDDRCYGPGVADMKGGLVLAAMAVERYAASDRPFSELRFLVCADEEVRLRAPSICAHAAGCSAALVFECGRENGDIVSVRKGAVWRMIELTGRAAHAGADTARGRSAVAALAHEILRIEGLVEGRPEMTSVITTVMAGDAANTVPGHARATIDIRSSDPQDLVVAVDELERGGPYNGVTIEIVDRGTWPPMQRHPGLVEAALQHAADIGLQIGEQLAGGVSDGCWPSAEGGPSIDGLGPVGGLDHTVDEWVELQTVEQRLALTVRLIASAATMRV